jgi:tripartite-type tricarboxylate transporter receptor subunit TctC
MVESGVKGFVVSSGFSFIGPAGMPKPVVEKLNGALAKALQDPTVRKELISRGAEPVGDSSEQHGAYIKAEIDKWQKVAAHAGIKPE